MGRGVDGGQKRKRNEGKWKMNERKEKVEKMKKERKKRKKLYVCRANMAREP